jgi:hypothetical protein
MAFIVASASQTATALPVGTTELIGAAAEIAFVIGCANIVVQTNPAGAAGIVKTSAPVAEVVSQALKPGFALLVFITARLVLIAAGKTFFIRSAFIPFLAIHSGAAILALVSAFMAFIVSSAFQEWGRTFFIFTALVILPAATKADIILAD